MKHQLISNIAASATAPASAPASASTAFRGTPASNNRSVSANLSDRDDNDDDDLG